jgi:ATP-binding cassette subfamily B protein
LLVIEKVISLITPFAYKWIVDDLARPDPRVPTAGILLYAGGRFLSNAIGDVRDSIFAKLSQHAVHDMSVQTFRHLHDLSVDYHINKKNAGSTLRAIDRGVAAVEFLVSYAVFSIVPTLLEIVFVSLLVSIVYTLDVSTVMFATMVLYIGYTIVCTEWRSKFRREMNEKDNLASDRAADSLINFEIVKMFTNEKLEVKRYDEAMAAYNHAAVVSAQTLALLNIGQALIVAVGVLGVMFLAANQVVAKEMSVGDFVLLITYLLQLSIPLGWLGSSYRMIKNSIIDLERALDILEEVPDVQDANNAKTLVLSSASQARGPEVEFKNVVFGYKRNQTPLLKGVSFRVPAGRTLAIVGSSGSGKTTIGKLLFRFYDIWSGDITIDGQSIASITQESLRSIIAPVAQNASLFNDTLTYNVRYGRPSASDDDVHEAVRLAQLEPFVQALPEKYDVKVGEKGMRLSGGEQQRCAIARALIKGAPVTLLDEATSALDTQTEREIQAALQQVSRNRTTIVIAHRLSTIVDADEIIVLRQGVIAERGTHSSLLEQKGDYWKMWERQQEQRKAEETLESLKRATEEDGPLTASPGDVSLPLTSDEYAAHDLDRPSTSQDVSVLIDIPSFTIDDGDDDGTGANDSLFAPGDEEMGMDDGGENVSLIGGSATSDSAANRSGKNKKKNKKKR